MHSKLGQSKWKAVKLEVKQGSHFKCSCILFHFKKHSACKNKYWIKEKKRKVYGKLMTFQKKFFQSGSKFIGKMQLVT